jgi:LuxR family maltose regulon positive regulatory protein
MILARRPIFEGEILMQGYLSLARLKQARGDTEGARATLAEFGQLSQQQNFFDGLIANVCAFQAWFDLAADNIAAAAQWAETRGIRVDDEISFTQEREYLTLARLFIRMGRDNPKNVSAPKALQLLERLRATAQADGRLGSLIEILCLHALTFQVIGDQEQVRQSIEQAITIARPEGYIRTFLDEGEPLRWLLNDLWSEQKIHAPGAGTLDEPLHAYVEMLLAAFQAEGSTSSTPGAEKDVPARDTATSAALPDPLSKREGELLSLIAQGFSNREIAERWIVAPSTVKWYINNLYGKLGARSRTHALVRAREFGLL